jgi:hypothetical protein
MHFWPKNITVNVYERDCIGSLYVTAPKLLSFGLLLGICIDI